MRPATPVPRAGRALALAGAGAAYLGLAVVVWWGVWSGHPSSTTTCGCGDAAFTLWYTAFAAHALGTGAPLFHTALQWHPAGVDVLDQASQLGLGVPLAPVTWAWGPVAALDVALTLAPAASALAAFALGERWGLWRPASFAGGLLCGFSPLVVLNLAEAHLVVGCAAALPLGALALDVLLVGPCRRPVVVGVLLGLLAVWQLLISPEVLLLAVVAGGVVVAAVAAARAVADRRTAAVGLGTAGVVAVVLGAWPAWVGLAGPSHVSGAIYPGGGVAESGASLARVLWPSAPAPGFDAYVARIGGYQGPHLAAEYIGLGVVAVVVGGLVVWRRDRRLQLCAGVAALFLLFGTGSSPSGWRPWDLLAHLPLAQDVIPVRLLLVTWLGLAMAVALVADHVHRALAARSGGAWWTGRRAGAVAGLAVAAVALVPPAAELTRTVPLTVQHVGAPAWFTAVAPRLGPGQVVLVIPVPFSAIQSSLSWQVSAGFAFAMAGGDGPGSDLAHAGRHREAEAALAAVSASLGTAPPGPGAPAAVRRALADWGVTRVVLPHDPGLPAYDRPVDPAGARALVTAAVGHGPRSVSGSWVWTVGRPG